MESKISPIGKKINKPTKSDTTVQPLSLNSNSCFKVLRGFNDFNIEISNETVSIPNLLYQTILQPSALFEPKIERLSVSYVNEPQLFNSSD